MKKIHFPIGLIAFLVVFTSSFTFGQKIGKKAVLEDLNSLQDSIAIYQPVLQKYAPKFNEDVAVLKQSITKDSLTYLEHNELISRMCVFAREGHFIVGSIEDTVQRGIHNGTDLYLPIEVVVLNKKVYVDNDLSNEQTLERGAEVIGINGHPIDSILEELLQCIPADGSIQTHVMHQLNEIFAASYFLFIEQPKNFTVELKKSDGSFITTEVKAISTIAQSVNFLKFIHPIRPSTTEIEHPIYSLDFNPNYALLTLRSFDEDQLSSREIIARKLYKELFKSIKKAKSENLIIDLRGNGGGHLVMASELVPFLMKKTPENLFQLKHSSWDGKEKTYEFRRKSRRAFKGEVYVLIDGESFSSASTLARFIKEKTDAQFIGEETGSRYEGFAAGATHYIQLPNSGLSIGIPCYGFEFSVGEKQSTTDRGVFPDHSIQNTIDAVLMNRDLYIEKAASLIDAPNE